MAHSFPTRRSSDLLGEDAPAAIAVFSGRGRPGCEQLIDRYRIACRPVRDVLVDYLLERQPSVDFSTLQRLAYLLGKLFWADLEAHHPGIDSLSLTRDVAAAWKQRVMTKTRTTATGDGGEQTRVSARLDGRSVMTARCPPGHQVPKRKGTPSRNSWKIPRSTSRIESVRSPVGW